MRISVRRGVLVLAMMANACATPEPGVYRGGVLMKEGPLAAEDHYSFRFVDKWRISHRWLSGPTKIQFCEYGIGNPFRDLPGLEALSAESNPPMFEMGDNLIKVGTDFETKKLMFYQVARERIYGTNREGKFEGYSAFCGHVFRDIYDGIGLYIVKPDLAKGTDEWIKGAQSVTINGLRG